jgi:hypothetical protein
VSSTIQASTPPCAANAGAASSRTSPASLHPTTPTALLRIVEKTSDNTIGRTLTKNALKLHRNRQWVIPPEAGVGFVAAMEEVLATNAAQHPNA